MIESANEASQKRQRAARTVLGVYDVQSPMDLPSEGRRLLARLLRAIREGDGQ